MACCSSSGRLSATLLIMLRWDRTIAEPMPCESSAGEAGRKVPRSMRLRTAAVSRSASAGSTTGLIGPCTVTR